MLVWVVHEGFRWATIHWSSPQGTRNSSTVPTSFCLRILISYLTLAYETHFAPFLRTCLADEMQKRSCLVYFRLLAIVSRQLSTLYFLKCETESIYSKFLL